MGFVGPEVGVKGDEDVEFEEEGKKYGEEEDEGRWGSGKGGVVN